MINIKRYGTLCLSAILAAAFVLTPAVKIFAEEGDTAADREPSGRLAMQSRRIQMD